MIELKNICKSFRVAKRDPGLGQAVKALFHKQYQTIHALHLAGRCTGCGECAKKCPKKAINMHVREHVRDANAKVGTTKNDYAVPKAD